LSCPGILARTCTAARASKQSWHMISWPCTVYALQSWLTDRHSRLSLHWQRAPHTHVCVLQWSPGVQHPDCVRCHVGPANMWIHMASLELQTPGSQKKSKANCGQTIPHISLIPHRSALTIDTMTLVHSASRYAQVCEYSVQPGSRKSHVIHHQTCHLHTAVPPVDVQAKGTALPPAIPTAVSSRHSAKIIK
jgi:hypothetical protein